MTGLIALLREARDLAQWVRHDDMRDRIDAAIAEHEAAPESLARAQPQGEPPPPLQPVAEVLRREKSDTYWVHWFDDSTLKDHWGEKLYSSPPAQSVPDEMIKSLKESVASKDREIDRLLQLLSEKQAATHHPSLEELREFYEQPDPSGSRET